MSASFFAVQLAIRSPADDPWRESLVGLLRTNRRDLSLLEKRVLYSGLADMLLESEPRWVLGTWDLIRPPQGETEFDTWVSELEATVEEPLGTDAATGDHVIVTVVLLVPAEGRADALLGDRCDVPEADYLKASTYTRLVTSLRMLPFADVMADGVYVVPGDTRSGVPLAELRGEGWEYLKPVERAARRT